MSDYEREFQNNLRDLGVEGQIFTFNAWDMSNDSQTSEWEDDAPEEDKSKSKLAGMMSSNSGDWETPDFLFAALNSEFNFTLDAAASMENRKVQKFFSIHQDALKLQWHGSVWLNSPYGRGIGDWIGKAKNEAQERGSTVVCLVPARTDTNWWFDHARFGEVRFLKGRLKFKGAPTSAPFPSALIIYRPGMRRSTSYWHYREVDYAPFYHFTCLD